MPGSASGSEVRIAGDGDGFGMNFLETALLHLIGVDSNRALLITGSEYIYSWILS